MGEAYFTRYGTAWNTNLTLGKFRQQFGVINRWHKHALDWFDFPLALRSLFGPGGLTQVGLSPDWAGSTGPVVHGLTVQVTDADNSRMFGLTIVDKLEEATGWSVPYDIDRPFAAAAEPGSDKSS